MFEKEKETYGQLKDLLQKITEINSKSLIRTEELGKSFDFSNGVEIFDRTLKLFTELNEVNLDNIPLDILNNLKTSTNQAYEKFKKIQDFDPGEENNPAQFRDSLIKDIENTYHTYFKNISPIIAFATRKGTDFKRLEEDAKKAVSELDKIKQENEKKSSQLLAEVQDTLEKVRRAAAEVGVAQHAIHFMEEARYHRKRSSYWLIATIIFALITIVYGLWNIQFYSSKVTQLSVSQTIQFTVSKLIIFSILYFGVIWAGRVYKAHWHNYVVNKHRQNALSSFETFVKASSDDQTKSAVLLQATESIFAPQHSGFINQDIEQGGTPKIMEIVRSMVSTTMKK